jgi:hypothetical protein
MRKKQKSQHEGSWGLESFATFRTLSIVVDVINLVSYSTHLLQRVAKCLMTQAEKYEQCQVDKCVPATLNMFHSD